MIRRENAGAALVLFLLVAFALFPFVFGDRTLEDGAGRASSLYGAGSSVAPIALPPRESDPNAGALGSGQLALEHAIVTRDRAIPLWNPYSSYGAPLAADMQAQPYSPFAWIPILWSTARRFDTYVAARLFAGGLLAFLYLRLFTGVMPSLAGGVSYMFAGYLWLYVTTPQLSVEVLTPGLLLAMERVLRRPAVSGASLLAAFLASSVLGGMPEATALAVAFAYLYGIARCFGDPELRRNARASGAFVALGTVAGLAVSAILVLPFLEFVRVSSNSHQQGGAASLLDAPPDTLSLRALAQYVAPLLYGPPGAVLAGDQIVSPPLRGFFGASAAFFALVATFGRLGDALRNKRCDAPIAFLALVAVALVCKRFGFAFVEWIGSLPVLRIVIFEKYEEAIVACCVALLAGFGVARICERRASARELWAAAAIVLAVLSAAAALDQQAIAAQSAGQTNFFGALGVALVALSLAAAVSFAALRGFWSAPKLAGVFAVTILAAESLFAFVLPLYRDVPGEPAQAASPLLGAPYVDFVRSHLRRGERFFAQDNLLVPNWNEALEIPDVRGVDAIYWDRFLPFVRAFLPSRGFELVFWFRGNGSDEFSSALQRRFLELSSVRYVGTLHSLGGSHAGPARAELRPVSVTPGAAIYEFASPMPRVAAFRRVVHVRDGASALALLASPRFDVRSVAVVEGDDASFASLERAPSVRATAGSFESYGPTDVRVAIDAPSTSLVMLNDSDFPGWKAYLDGMPADIVAADYLFRGVVVPRGKHAIEYRYEPASFRVGAALTIVALFAIAAGGLTPLFRRRLRARTRRWRTTLQGSATERYEHNDCSTVPVLPVLDDGTDSTR